MDKAENRLVFNDRDVKNLICRKEKKQPENEVSSNDDFQNLNVLKYVSIFKRFCVCVCVGGGVKNIIGA
jgi:hypothetical protein